jgi:Rod binding domain-containing protein
MTLPAPHNLAAADSAAPRSLRPAVLGDIGRWDAAPQSEHDKLVDQTRTWVGQTFFGTLLKQMRDSPFKSELFSGGQGGQAFAQLHDQRMAEHMARGAGSKLVNTIVRRIEANAAYRKQAAAGVGGPAAADNRTPDGRAGDPRQMRTAAHAAPARRP